MGLIDSTRKFLGLERSVYPPMLPGVDNWWPYLNFNSNTYGIGLETTMTSSRTEEPGSGFLSLVSSGYKGNSVIFACEMTRIQVFSQARFKWQRLVKGQPDNLFGTGALDILEHPWAGGTTGDLLTKMLVHADFGGNAFVTKRPSGLKVMRPDWITIVHGSPNDDDVLADDLDAALLGYVYYPGGRGSGRTPIALPVRDAPVAHFAPIPDPTAPARGMSWLTPIVRDVMSDSAATVHKLKFFENAGTPNMVIKRVDTPSPTAFKEWVEMMEAGHAGAANAYKTLYLTAGADATVVGKDLQQLEFKATQGAGETRIAAAAGTHPVIVGLSEGMQGSSLNAGNFNSARRLMADKTLWHLWSNLAGSMETLAPAPKGSRLWVDDRIPFLREDRKDAAEIEQVKSQTIAAYIDKGFTRDSAVEAVAAEDVTLLKPDPEWVSVQVQAAGAPDSTAPVEAAPPKPSNGTKPKSPIGGAKT